MNPTLKVHVIGPTNTGKSTVAQLVKDALHEHHIPSTIDDIDKPNLGWFEKQKERLAHLCKRKLSVDIKVIQTSRHREPPQPQKVAVMLYHHRHGADVSVAETVDELRLRRVAIVLDWLDDVDDDGKRNTILNLIQNSKFVDAVELYCEITGEHFDIEEYTIYESVNETDLLEKAALRARDYPR